MNRSSVNIARLVYLLVCQAAGVAIALSSKGTPIEFSITSGLLIGLAIGLTFIGIERLMEGFTLRGFSTATFGLGVGLFCAWLLTRVEISNLLELAFRDRVERAEDGEALVNSLRLAVDVTLFASLGFLGATLALRGNREDFAFIIPYVRFRQDSSSGQPIVLDADTVMDGRMIGLIESGFLSGRLIVASYILEEIQTLANEAENGLKQRAQRGLDNLTKIQKAPETNVSIYDARSIPEAETPHARLIETSRFFGARLMTLDESLTRIAKLQGVSVLNLNELDQALKPPVAVGERLHIALVRPGKEDHQAVGYLPDGTMVVVNDSSGRIGESVNVVVMTTLQTASGILVFAEIQNS
ncbi:MAG: PIN/TRAM domain-containing protein [Akkermansiaceae bacterium]